MSTTLFGLTRRQRWFGGVALVVLAAHALLYVALMPAWFDRDDLPGLPPVMQVRSVIAAPPVDAPAAPPLSSPPRPVPPLARTPPAPGARAPTVASAPAVTAPSDNMVASADEAAEPVATSAELTVYPTRLPGAGTWRYAMQRGLAGGEATLAWQPTSDGRYTLQLQGRVAGLTVLDWVSQGRLDAAGIAPERFSIRRRGRDAQAANFQRDAGKITFSGPTHEVPLLAGVQDRLSWMLQLAAIVDASPSQRVPGARVTLMVIGARGGVGLWRFAVTGPEQVGDTPALKLVHEPERPRDTRVEVWLDPAQGHLPLRARLTPPENGAPLELQLQGRDDKGSTGP